MTSAELVYLDRLTRSCEVLVKRFPYYLHKDCLDELNSIVYLAYIDAKSKGFENKESSIRVTVLHRLKDFICTLNGLSGSKYQFCKKLNHTRHSLIDHALPEQNVGELFEIIEACCPSDVVRDIVFLRIQGYTQQEIAEKTGLSQKLISIHLAEFKHKLWKAYYAS